MSSSQKKRKLSLSKRFLLLSLFIFFSANSYAQFTGMPIPNEGTTGTALNRLAKLTAGSAVIATTADTRGLLGIVIKDAGTTGNAYFARSGSASCVFDGATTAGDYVVASVTSAGACHSYGSSFPASFQVLGRVLSTNGAGGTYSMIIFSPEIGGFGGCGYSGVPLSGGTNGSNLSTGTNSYASLVRQTTDSGTSTANTDPVMCGGTLSNFQVTISGSPGGGANRYTFTIRVNDAGSSLSCAVTSGNTTCSDAGSLVLSPGDVINVESVPNSNPTGRSATWTVTYDQDVGSQL